MSSEIQPEKITHLNQWGWAYVANPPEMGGGQLILQSGTGLERIHFHMDSNTVRKLRSDLMGIIQA